MSPTPHIRRLRHRLLLASVALFLALPRPLLALPPPELDAEGRNYPSAFPTPDALIDAVQFWGDLFVRYSSKQVVLHDKADMRIVWQVLPLPTHAVGGAVDERLSTQMQRAAVQDLSARLARLEIDGQPQDGVDSQLLEVAKIHGPLALAGASERVRIQRGVSDHFRAGLVRARPWMADIRRILRKEGVPEELMVLPFVESMYNPRARSAAGAVGLWQLMPATARGLGLKVSRRADERTHVLKATRAAARMLRQNHRILGNWPLAITAYNHGPNGLKRAVVAVGSNDLVDLIEKYERSSWGFASKNFYAEFLAALSVVNSEVGSVASLPPPSRRPKSAAAAADGVRTGPASAADSQPL